MQCTRENRCEHCKFRDDLLTWVYGMLHALSTRKCQARIAWQPEIHKALNFLLIY